MLQGLLPANTVFIFTSTAIAALPTEHRLAVTLTQWMKNTAPTDKIRHEGDMGNMEADNTGHAHLEYVDPMLSFNGRLSIIGLGIIVHQGEDDLHSQPTGDAGARVACGIIGIAKD